ncbi:MAG: polysaccharide deacetylase family protein [Hyphomicrobiales bacterium]|nr:polysaccharide deacetylase family protein [Hyphomicrobiales bacterium]
MGLPMRPRPRPLILMYHRIASAKRDPWGLAVSPDRFATQIAVLKERRQVLPLRTFVQLHLDDRLPADATAITFDDGYACNARVASPLLQDRNLPATFFIATGAIDNPREFWWDELERLVFETPASELVATIGGEEIPMDLGEPAPSETDFNALAEPRTPRQATYLRLWQALRTCSAEQQAASLGRLWRQSLGEIPPARSSHRCMTGDELRALARSELAEIGAHTVTHPLLSQLEPDRRRTELSASKAACESFAERPVRSFAYPYGDLDESTVELVREAGFAVACTTQQRPVTRAMHALKLPRLQVQNWDADRFQRML